MKHLRETGLEYADITLICQGKKFPAHKLILAARSDVFSRMFQHQETKEALSKEVEMRDTDPENVSKFLE